MLAMGLRGCLPGVQTLASTPGCGMGEPLGVGGRILGLSLFTFAAYLPVIFSGIGAVIFSGIYSTGQSGK
jgi:hypothetical protein